MSNVIICVGISGSGKSTWSTQLLKHSTDYIRCNRDDIRRTLIGDLIDYYGRRDLNGFEKIVSNIEYFIWETAIKKNKSVIIDNTNLKISTVNKILNYFYSNGYTAQFKLFDYPLKDAKDNIIVRDGYLVSLDENHKNICSKVNYIDRQYKQYQSIKKWILETHSDNIIT